jgi:hypothetical protein
MSKKDEESLILMALITINYFYIISGKESAFKNYQENLKNLTEEGYLRYSNGIYSIIEKGHKYIDANFMMEYGKCNIDDFPIGRKILKRIK